MAPSHSAKCYLVCFPLGKKHVVDKFCSSMSYSVVGCEFNVNESTVYLKHDVFEQKHMENKVCVHWLMKMLWPGALRNLAVHFL